ncbi:MAG: hypothetical protein R6U98_22305, partial [Pirellulaceae bacterium]
MVNNGIGQRYERQSSELFQESTEEEVSDELHKIEGQTICSMVGINCRIGGGDRPGARGHGPVGCARRGRSRTLQASQRYYTCPELKWLLTDVGFTSVAFFAVT